MIDVKTYGPKLDSGWDYGRYGDSVEYHYAVMEEEEYKGWEGTYVKTEDYLSLYKKYINLLEL